MSMPIQPSSYVGLIHALLRVLVGLLAPNRDNRQTAKFANCSDSVYPFVILISYCKLIFRVWTAAGDFKSGWPTRQMSLLVGPMKIWYRPQMWCITKMPGLQSRLLLLTIWQKPCMIMSWKIQSNSVWHHTSHHSIRAMVCPYLNIRTFSHFNCYRPNGLSKHSCDFIFVYCITTGLSTSGYQSMGLPMSFEICKLIHCYYSQPTTRACRIYVCMVWLLVSSLLSINLWWTKSEYPYCPICPVVLEADMLRIQKRI